MQLKNTTVVILSKVGGKFVASRVVENPEVPSKGGQPIIGPMMKRLMTVGQIAAALGCSKNKASEYRRKHPIACLDDFPGQEPLAGMLRAAILPVAA